MARSTFLRQSRPRVLPALEPVRRLSPQQLTAACAKLRATPRTPYVPADPYRPLPAGVNRVDFYEPSFVRGGEPRGTSTGATAGAAAAGGSVGSSATKPAFGSASVAFGWREVSAAAIQALTAFAAEHSARTTPELVSALRALNPALTSAPGLKTAAQSREEHTSWAR